jgi:hypothetical protein
MRHCGRNVHEIPDDAKTSKFLSRLSLQATDPIYWPFWITLIHGLGPFSAALRFIYQNASHIFRNPADPRRN